jgi:hypothetical protein
MYASGMTVGANELSWSFGQLVGVDNDKRRRRAEGTIDEDG